MIYTGLYMQLNYNSSISCIINNIYNMMMIVEGLKKNINTIRFGFATQVNKKQKMELTLRTPYKTILKDFDGF